MFLSSFIAHRKKNFTISPQGGGHIHAFFLPDNKSLRSLHAKNKSASRIKSTVINSETYEKIKKAEKNKALVVKKANAKKFKKPLALSQKKANDLKKVITPKQAMPEQIASESATLESAVSKSASIMLQSSLVLRGKKSAHKKNENKITYSTASIDIGEIEFEVDIGDIVQDRIKLPAITKSEMASEPEISVEFNQDEFGAKQEVNFSSEISDLPEELLGVGIADVEFHENRERDDVATSEKLEQMVCRHWNPPVGMSKGIACTMEIAVNSKGRATKVKIIKGSGTLIYDTTARKAMLNISEDYPKEVWGTTFNFTL